MHSPSAQLNATVLREVPENLDLMLASRFEHVYNPDYLARLVKPYLPTMKQWRPKTQVPIV
jgi:hypothetical protein